MASKKAVSFKAPIQLSMDKTEGQGLPAGLSIDKAVFLRKFTENALQQVKEVSFMLEPFSFTLVHTWHIQFFCC
ncbi:hypothetical protein FBU59_000037 [Linderina macrospora]|uniref:Uncharacterized protein n=1 Tax=Linderina macrospora TaxID=4868 RepID=A0ACC1JI53_9FUNG|nr:hypothetical protein FBU59_000037 [Linderina macrospora]